MSKLGCFYSQKRGGWFGGSSHGKNFGGFFTLNKTGFLLSHPHIPSLSFLKKKYITLKFQNAQPIIILYTFSFYFSFCFFFCDTKSETKEGKNWFLVYFSLLLSQEPKPVCSKKFFMTLDVFCGASAKRKTMCRPPAFNNQIQFEHTMRDALHCNIFFLQIMPKCSCETTLK